ncbi:MAG: Ig-like domain-containing protein [Archangium sp.]
MIKVMAVLATLLSGPAFALSCSQIEQFYPRHGATNVPLNAVLRVTYLTAAKPGVTELWKNGTVQIPLVRETSADGRVTNFVPQVPLEANTTYTFMGPQFPYTFTTGDREDHDAPATAQFDSATFESPGTPDSYRKWRLQLITSDATSRNDQLLVLVRDAKKPGVIIGATDATQPTLDVEICGNNFAPPEGSTFALDLQVMDLAGNVSELSRASDIEASKSGCSAAPGAVLLVLASLVFRRRRSA